MTRPLYRELASLLGARATCQRRADAAGDSDHQAEHWGWFDRHTESIEAIMKSAPSGSGIDRGINLVDSSTSEKLVFYMVYHHMNDVGYYDGWTEHTVTVRPSLQFGIDIKISGRDRNEIKDYFHDVFHTWLTTEV